MRSQTEVGISNGYVADVAAILSLQNRFWTYYCEVARVRPITLKYDGWENGRPVYHQEGEAENYLLCIMEAKQSRGDFLSTFNESDKHANRKEPFGNLHWCIAEKGVCAKEELPTFWGLLVPKGNGLSEVKPPVWQPSPPIRVSQAERALLWAIGTRRSYGSCHKCGAYSKELYCKRCSWDAKKDDEFEKVTG